MSFEKVLLEFKVPYHKDLYLFYMEGFIEIVGDGGFFGWDFTTLFFINYEKFSVERFLFPHYCRLNSTT